MPNLIGITTDLERKKSELSPVYRHAREWHIVAGPYDSNREAQRARFRYSILLCCEIDSGLDDPEDQPAPWYVYVLRHNGRKK